MFFVWFISSRAKRQGKERRRRLLESDTNVEHLKGFVRKVGPESAYVEVDPEGSPWWTNCPK